jgi:hypothetical protein
MRGRHQQEGVAVGFGAGDLLSGDIAAGADARVENDRLTERLRHLGAEHPGDRVGVTAGGKSLHEADRPRRILLRERAHRAACEASSERHQAERTQSGAHRIRGVDERRDNRRRVIVAAR